MKKTFTVLHRVVLLVLALGASLTSRGQYSYRPVTLTAASFNADIVANGTAAAPPASSATADVDGTGYYFLSQDYYTATTAHTSGIPNSGLIQNSIAGYSSLTYQLASLSGPNALRIPGTATGTGTLTFATPVAATEVYVLGSSGSAISTVTFTVNYSDATTTVVTGQTYPDWFTTSSSQNVFGMSARASATTPISSVTGANTAPFLNQVKLTIPTAKVGLTITSIGVSKTSSGGYLQLMAVSILPTCTGVPVGQTAFAATTSGGSTALTTACPSTSIYLSVPTQGSVTYQWQSSTDNFNTSINNITGATSPTYTATGQTVTTYYRVVETCPYDGSGGTATPSASVQVSQNPSYNCTCSPTSAASNEYLTNVTVGSINNSSTNQSSTAPVDYTSTGGTTTLNQGGTYPITVTGRDNASGSSAAVWIDYNQNGTFETSEFTLIGSGPVSGSPLFYTPQLLTLTGALAIPATATTGVTKMRVRWKNGLALNSEACTNYGGGETEDYLVTIGAATSCTGGAAVSISGAPLAICPTVPFSLAAGGSNATSGVTYQWQSSPAGAGTFTNVSAASATTGTLIISQTAATDYRVIATCGGSPTTSSPVTVGLTAFANCYCTPSAAVVPTPAPTVAGSPTAYLSSTNGCGTYAAIPSVTMTAAGNTVFTASPGCAAASPYYVNNTSGATGSLATGTAYTVSGTLGKYARLVAWIDYDHSGTFDASEYTLLGTNTSTTSTTTTYSATITVPAGALSGVTRLRFRTEANTGTSLTANATNMGNSCVTTTYGETVDYNITITPSVACTGTPPAITVVSSATTVCSSTSFTLTASGPAAGTSGLSYQFQSRTGTNAFANLGTAQALATYTVASQTLATDYQVIVTCTASGLSTTSGVVSVAQSPFQSCYCLPTYSSTSSSSDAITRVVLGTLNNPSGYSPPYTDYSSTQNAVPDLVPGGSATVQVTFGTDGNQYNGVWIDFNQNGVFDTSEFFTSNSNAGGSGTASITINVPIGAMTGQTRMRVRGGDDSQPTSGQACGNSNSTSFGEGEDYQVNVIVPVACSGTPAATTATTTTSTACASTSFTLGATGIASGISGLSYQWQSSPANANAFINLGTAQATASYSVTGLTASTDYRVIVTCANGGTATTSSTVAVTFTAGCYCTPTSTPANEYITNLTLPGVNGFSSNSTNPTTSPTGFSDYTATAALTTTLYRGVPYVNGISASFRSNDLGSQGAMWIDYDHSGTFDAGEYSLLGNSDAIATIVTFTQNLTVPTSALLGPTRVRVRWRNDPFTSADACVTGSTTWYGETEDYLITIADAPTCTAPPATVTATSSVPSTCSNGSFSLSTNSTPTTLSGFTYQWQSRTGTSAFADIAGATTNPYTINNQAAATDYRLIVSCQYGGTPVTSNTVAVAQNPFDQCYCTTSSTNGCSQYGSITNVSIGTLNNASTCAPSTYTVYAATGTATTDLPMGASSALTLSIANAATYSYRYAVWIDFNHNGTFEASEFVASGTPSNSATATASIVIPLASASVLSGPTRMRIRTNAGIASYGNFAAGDACSVTYNGETEDYTVNLVPVGDLTVSTTTGIPAGTYNNVTITPTGNGTLTGATVVNGNLIVSTGGTLHTACQPLTGAGTFMMAAGATLDICDPQGITLSGATGAIQLATRLFSVAGTYIYSGSAAQVTGSALPARVRNLTVSTSNGAALTLSQPVAIRRLLTLTSGNVLNGQNLTLRSDADSTALVSVGSGTVSGSATVQRYISAATNAGLGYRHFSSPVTNTTVADLATASFSPSVSQGAAYNSSATPGLVTPFPTVFGYNESRQATSSATGYSVFDRGWQAPVSTSDALQSGKGYTVNLAGGQMVDFVGTLGTGNVALPLTRGTTTDAGWNLVGNPYPSTLNWDNVAIPTGMDAAVYVYRSASQYAGSYTSYTNGLGTSGGRTATIGMGQAFFVRVSPGTTATTLTLTDAARSTDFGSASTFQRGNDLRPRVRLALESANSTLSDAAYVYFEAGATTGIDARYDAVKLANPTGLSLSAVAAGTELAINGLPLASTTTAVPLTVAVPQAGTYTLRADELLNLTNGPVYLLDALTGQQVDLLQQASYSFSATGAARIAGRFSLGFPAAGPLATQPGLSAASVSVYPNPAHTSFTVLVPAVPGAKQVQMALFNSLGQRVREQLVTLGTTGAQATVEVKDLAAGIYTLRLQVAGQAAVARRVAVE